METLIEKSTNAVKGPLYKWQQDWANSPSGHEPTPRYDELPVAIAKQIQDMHLGQYRSGQLSGFDVPKPQGGLRRLAVPSFYERVIQTTVARHLAFALDQLMSQYSYGYRKGYSRQQAIEQLQRQYRQGARWVVDADIDRFFDEVSFHHIECRLQNIFPDEPLIPIIMQWISAPVCYNGQVIPRSKGLPQGSPISPVLADLMLDDFDADLARHGFSHVRFADDFVIACKTQQQAQRASEVARQSLAEHGLTLNSEKTRIVSFEQGFHFVGYLLCNDLALDVGSANKKRSTPSVQPSKGWATEADAQLAQPTAQACQTSAHSVEANLAIGDDASGPIYDESWSDEENRGDEYGSRDEYGSLVCITGAPCVLSTEGGRLIISRDDQCVNSFALRGLRSVLLLGRHHLTQPAIVAALKYKVAIHLCSKGGVYQGVISQGQATHGHKLWLSQQTASQNAAIALPVAKSLITARIRHQQELLRQKQWPVPKELGECLSGVQKAQSPAQVMGHEGLASQLFFNVIKTQLDAKWGFTQRNRRPPKDPLNVLLSMGYTYLYAHMDSLILMDGLCPQIGFLHQSHGRHSALASDLMEPFRHVVERAALTLLSTQQLKPQDFSQTENGCQLSRAGRRQYYGVLAQRFEQTLKSREQDSGTLIQHMAKQNQLLINLLRNKGEFKAWRQR